MQKRYNIYPSLLIAYQNLLDYEQVAEEDWNRVSDACQARGEYTDREVGDYKLSPEEMYLKLEADLLDSINRVDGRFSEAASKGTAFNEIVDCLIENRKSSRDDCQIYSTHLPSGEKVIRAEIDGSTFDFDIALCKETAAQFAESIPQYLAQADLETVYGTAHLYGYIDEWVGNKMYDIKTTGSYRFGKFEHGWQRYLYPWCVIQAGDTTEVESFTYYVIEWAYQRKGEPLRAKGVYTETYTYDHAEATRKLQEMVESFIYWLEQRVPFIQDQKIFGGENPTGWHGTPVDTEQLKQFLFNQQIN
jgi:hypothetical protein